MKTKHPGLSLSNRNFTIVLSNRRASRIILSVPHDCLPPGDFDDLFESRKNGATVRDFFVWPIAMRILTKCLRYGLRMDAVRSLMSRVYVDMNRSLINLRGLETNCSHECSIEDELLLSVVNEYHSSLHRLIQRSIRRFGRENVLLLDLHGFGKQPGIAPPEGYDLILGTANRRTIHHGSPDIDFAVNMSDKGYQVFLPREHTIVAGGDPYDAGHITRFYAREYGINAMQIEIAPMFRRLDIDVNAKRRGEGLATDIAEFLSSRYC